jgi:hypothetical protein
MDQNEDGSDLGDDGKKRSFINVGQICGVGLTT